MRFPVTCFLREEERGKPFKRWWNFLHSLEKKMKHIYLFSAGKKETKIRGLVEKGNKLDHCGWVAVRRTERRWSKLNSWWWCRWHWQNHRGNLLYGCSRIFWAWKVGWYKLKRTQYMISKIPWKLKGFGLFYSFCYLFLWLEVIPDSATKI